MAEGGEPLHDNNKRRVYSKHANDILIKAIYNDNLLKYLKRKRPDIIENVQQCCLENTDVLDAEKVYVNAKLRLEERGISHDETIFRCSPFWRVIKLKFEIHKKYDTIRPEHMYVLHGHDIAEDTFFLCDIGINNEDDMLYVFISRQNFSPSSLETRPSLLHQLSNTPVTSFDNSSNIPGHSQLTHEKNRIIGNIDTIQLSNVLQMQKLPQTLKEDNEGWRCPDCTYVNEPTRPGCEQCSASRPEGYILPKNYTLSDQEQNRIKREDDIEKQVQKEEDETRAKNYQNLVSVEEKNIVTSDVPIECKICFTENDPEETVVLKECLHKFCKDCLVGHLNASEDAMVKCPFADDDYACNNIITEREIKALLNPEEFNKYLSRGLSLAEASLQNTFHCKTPDCKGWCEYDDEVNLFKCPICEKINCLTCKALHEGLNCKQYQEELELKSAKDKNAQKTREALNSMLEKGEAMHCPRCNIILMKKDGCDWLKCTMCKLEICWVTKGPRWGPNGNGDNSGGCKCRLNGKKCHKNCVNCH